MRWRIVAIYMLLAVPARAGPYCGGWGMLAPAADTVLPVAPTIAYGGLDDYYAGRQRAKADPARVRATIDGVRVELATRDVRTKDGVIRLIKVRSRRTGELVVKVGNELPVRYQIAASEEPGATPTATITRDHDRGMADPGGTIAVVTVDVPAIAFVLRWRRDADDEWRVRPLPAYVVDNHSSAHFGQTMCGRIEVVPVPFLERGLEVELTAKLPDGSDVAVPLPRPFVLPPPRPVSAGAPKAS